jgi:hypothetical protein
MLVVVVVPLLRAKIRAAAGESVLVVVEVVEKTRNSSLMRRPSSSNVDK